MCSRVAYVRWMHCSIFASTYSVLMRIRITLECQSMQFNSMNNGIMELDVQCAWAALWHGRALLLTFYKCDDWTWDRQFSPLANYFIITIQHAIHILIHLMEKSEWVACGWHCQEQLFVAAKLLRATRPDIHCMCVCVCRVSYGYGNALSGCIVLSLICLWTYGFALCCFALQ